MVNELLFLEREGNDYLLRSEDIDLCERYSPDNEHEGTQSDAVLSRIYALCRDPRGREMTLVTDVHYAKAMHHSDPREGVSLLTYTERTTLYRELDEFLMSAPFRKSGIVIHLEQRSEG